MTAGRPTSRGPCTLGRPATTSACASRVCCRQVSGVFRASRHLWMCSRMKCCGGTGYLAVWRRGCERVLLEAIEAVAAPSSAGVSCACRWECVLGSLGREGASLQRDRLPWGPMCACEGTDVVLQHCAVWRAAWTLLRARPGRSSSHQCMSVGRSMICAGPLCADTLPASHTLDRKLPAWPHWVGAGKSPKGNPWCGTRPAR